MFMNIYIFVYELNRATEQQMGRVQYIKGHQGQSLGLRSKKHKRGNYSKQQEHRISGRRGQVSTSKEVACYPYGIWFYRQLRDKIHFPLNSPNSGILALVFQFPYHYQLNTSKMYFFSPEFLQCFYVDDHLAQLKISKGILIL